MRRQISPDQNHFYRGYSVIRFIFSVILPAHGIKNCVLRGYKQLAFESNSFVSNCIRSTKNRDLFCP